MKLKPYHIPPPRELDENEHALLRNSAAFGDAPVTLQGSTWFAAARRLAKLGLGEVTGRKFRATRRGLAAVVPPCDQRCD